MAFGLLSRQAGSLRGREQDQEGRQGPPGQWEAVGGQQGSRAVQPARPALVAGTLGVAFTGGGRFLARCCQTSSGTWVGVGVGDSIAGTNPIPPR